jgi:PAS domain S-box-containing protein
MGWLFLGVLYSSAYAAFGWLLRGQPEVLSWFRAAALLAPPLTGATVIFTRRHTWRGCQWLFWATIALGLTMSALGLTGWAAEEILLGHGTWLAWPAVFALFGGVAPLFALLAQPHRGSREPLAATTAIDIAGLAVVTGFLYSFFITAPSATSLILVSELQQGLVVAGMTAAMCAAWRTPWRATYRRLTLGALVSLATLTLSNVEVWQGTFHTAFVYDFTWILPFAFFPWAARLSPQSEQVDVHAAEQEELSRPRPWVIFTAVALLPFLDFGLRQIAPAEEVFKGFRDLSTAITIISVLPLLVARIAAERAELQQAGATMRLMAQVIEQTDELVLVMTADGRCRHANAAFCRAMQSSREELLRRRPRELMANDTVSAEDIQSVVRANGSWRGTVMRTRPDGSTFPVSATVAALRGERGEATHFVSIERDISEERRLREQLIYSERLSAVGQLVAGVAHELNNPLQGVMGQVELLIGTEDRPGTRHDLQQIRRSGERAAKIVRKLLTFARHSALERSVADLNEIVRSTIALRAHDLRAAGIAVAEDYAEELPLIIVNRGEIQQAVLNLLLNAEEALRAARRPGTVRVRTALAADPGSVLFEIADDGAGVPHEVANRIFEPFFTTRSSAEGEGTGLGLSVSLGIAAAHGGSLVLLPSPRGARFALTLPMSAVQAVTAEEQTAVTM